MTSAWQASNSYSVGDVVRATTQQGTGLVFRCGTAGTSGNSEPSWPRILFASHGRTTTWLGDKVEGWVRDGTVVWHAVSSTYDETSKLNPSAIIELYSVQFSSAIHGLSETKRFFSGMNRDIDAASTADKKVVWAGDTYEPAPVKVDGFEYQGQGQLPRPTLTISNLLSATSAGTITGTITAMMLEINSSTYAGEGNDFCGAEFRRIRTLLKFLDATNFPGNTNPYGTPDPNQCMPEEIYIIARKVVENREVVQWEMRSAFDMAGVRAPKRQAMPDEFPGIGSLVY